MKSKRLEMPLLDDEDEVVWVSDDDLTPFCRNWKDLSFEDKIKVSEMIYARQMRRSWGFRLDDPRLTSGDKVKDRVKP